MYLDHFVRLLSKLDLIVLQVRVTSKRKRRKGGKNLEGQDADADVASAMTHVAPKQLYIHQLVNVLFDEGEGIETKYGKSCLSVSFWRVFWSVCPLQEAGRDSEGGNYPASAVQVGDSESAKFRESLIICRKSAIYVCWSIQRNDPVNRNKKRRCVFVPQGASFTS